MYKGIESEADVKELQMAIDEMYQWTQKWLLNFNKEKCKILHLGKNNEKNEYFIGTGDNRIPLDETELEKDLGVYVDPNLDFKSHIKNTVKKANYTVYKIIKNFSFRDADILVPLFKALVRPILEYGNSVWSVGIKKYMSKIENVQRKFTKYIRNLHNMTYEERLKKINLPSIEYRQFRGDQIQVFKIARGFYDTASTETIFEFKKDTRLRGHMYKINKTYVNKSKYKHFFSNRVINKWNSLPQDIVTSKTINEFKNKFDNYYKDIQFSIDTGLYT